MFKDIKRNAGLLIAAIVMAAAVSGAPGYALKLGDIEGHWAQNNIEWMVEEGYLSGYPDGSFRPNNSITRAEFAAMIVKVETFDRNPYRGVFGDVNAKDWHSAYVQTAYDKGWIKGSDGKFKPSDSISRTEMAVIMGRIAKLESEEPVDGRHMIENFFVDRIEIPFWARDDMSYVLHNKIMRGMDGDRFAPGSPSTRAESTRVIYNTLQFFGNI